MKTSINFEAQPVFKNEKVFSALVSVFTVDQFLKAFVSTMILQHPWYCKDLYTIITQKDISKKFWKKNYFKIENNYPLKLPKLPKLPKRPWILDPIFAGINLFSSCISCKRALVSAPSALPFSKILVNVLTTGRNCCLSWSVMRLVSESGKTPENKEWKMIRSKLIFKFLRLRYLLS